MAVLTRQEPERWESHRLTGAAVDVSIVLVPLALAVGAALAVWAVLPAARSVLEAILWWVISAAAATFVLTLVERPLRRLWPLASLLRLSLVFPGQAPSRFALALRAGGVATLRQRAGLDDDVQAPDQDAGKAAADILTLATSLGCHDGRTRGHSERVRAYAELIGEELGLTRADRDRLRWAALLHDVGKLEVHPAILNKDGPLNQGEWSVIHLHPVAGARMIAPLKPWLGEWAAAVEQHHERWDGGGYPYGLAGTEISLAARIVAVADAYEVMTAARSYKRPVSAAAARAELARCAGTSFDPMVVRAFLNISVGRLAWAMGPAGALGALPLARPVLGATPRLVVMEPVRMVAALVIVAGAATAGLAGGGGGAVPSPPGARLVPSLSQPGTVSDTPVGLWGSSPVASSPVVATEAIPGGAGVIAPSATPLALGADPILWTAARVGLGFGPGAELASSPPGAVGTAAGGPMAPSTRPSTGAAADPVPAPSGSGSSPSSVDGHPSTDPGRPALVTEVAPPAAYSTTTSAPAAPAGAPPNTASAPAAPAGAPPQAARAQSQAAPASGAAPAAPAGAPPQAARAQSQAARAQSQAASAQHQAAPASGSASPGTGRLTAPEAESPEPRPAAAPDAPSRGHRRGHGPRRWPEARGRGHGQD